MKISVIGTGYVGLVQGAGLAAIHGHQVMCMDVNTKRIEELQAGKIPIHEPGLEEWVHSTYERGKQWTAEGINFKNTPGEFNGHPNPNGGTLYFSSALGQAAAWGDVIFICVGTPSNSDGSVDISILRSLRESLWSLKLDNKIIIVKSTVPPGTTNELFKDFVIGKNIKTFAMNPEFLREGKACKDFLCPDRIIIGYDSQVDENVFKEIYNTGMFMPPKIDFCTTREAELTKYASNAFLAMKISYAHEVQAIASKCGANPMVVLELVGKDNRIGSQFLHPGIGFGGSCFPKDTLGFINIAEKWHIDPLLTKATIAINDTQRVRVRRAIMNYILANQLKSVTFLGTAFKEDTDDTRESRALYIIRDVAGILTNVAFKVHDPQATPNSTVLTKYHKNITLHSKLEEVSGTELYVLLTPWAEYIDFLKDTKRPVLDLRNTNLKTAGEYLRLEDVERQ